MTPSPTIDSQELPERTCEDGCNGCEDCTDYDDECVDVRNKVTCWLYDPARGMCPYLRPARL